MNNGIVVQAMKELDIDQVLKLWSDIFGSSFLESSVTKSDLIGYLKKNPETSSVACNGDGKVIGALLCGNDGVRGFIYHIAIYEEYRVNEINKSMLDRSLKKLKEVGIKTGFIFTQKYNHDTDVAFNSIGWDVIPNEFNLNI
ncbi:GNAT family N-acetyltransferase [Clostridium chromiireducens]|uniref:Acetyltransferase YpeA n=1 Tax=Clostridium chromiireducens TaxID=225345 RepID=A0A1V4ICE8_9CLOT|nr:GNAT family N-acetyltransferase [Clostridium chromiireducens]OPJ57682.1 acetyltransferase YpeA [Clostridium chromiireducens]RII35554.1 GNAT family N-acetyltransferase [Clostridium chromiireducens]